MLPTTDTALIELYFTNHLNRKDARQFELRLLRDAVFLEKVFMYKARVGELKGFDFIVKPLKSIKKKSKKPPFGFAQGDGSTNSGE